MSKLVVGIDPGKQGYLCVVIKDSKGLRVVEQSPMPLDGEGDIDPYGVINVLSLWGATYNPKAIIIERQSAMSKQGVSSTFTNGVGYGIVYALSIATSIPVEVVDPKKWQNHFKKVAVVVPPDLQNKKSIKDTKKRTISICADMFPGLQLRTDKGRWLDGLADSVMIGSYALLSNLV